MASRLIFGVVDELVQSRACGNTPKMDEAGPCMAGGRDVTCGVVEWSDPLLVSAGEECIALKLEPFRVVVDSGRPVDPLSKGSTATHFSTVALGQLSQPEVRCSFL